MATETGAAAMFDEGHGADHLPNGMGALYSNAAVREHGMPFGEALLGEDRIAVQVSIDGAMGAEAGGPIAVWARATGADAEDVPDRCKNLSSFVGIVAASSAVTAIAAGAVSPAVAFGFFVVLLGGLSLIMSAVRGA